MPSKLIDATKRKTSVPFSTSAQTVSSVGIFLHCINCCWPRLLYAQKKVQASVLNTLKLALNGFQFICGMSLQEIILDDNTPEQKIVSKVFARENISCMSNIETPYFSSGKFTKICIICGKSTNLPKCHWCNNARIKITRRSKILVEDLGRKKRRSDVFYLLQKIKVYIQHCIKHSLFINKKLSYFRIILTLKKSYVCDVGLVFQHTFCPEQTS